MMKWLKEILKVLKHEPEVWLAYSYGQKLYKMPTIINSRPKIRGFLIRIFVFIFQVGKYFTILRSPRHVRIKANYLMYASTLNQLRALKSTLCGLEELGENFILISDAKFKNELKCNLKNFYTIRSGLFVILKTIVLVCYRGPDLIRELKKKDRLLVDACLNQFLLTHFFSVYFFDVLKATKPSFVVVTNDHNPANRCLLAAAHVMKIKTVYLQHASVTKLFPALRVNYAFLDGAYARDIYLECEKNQPPGGFLGPKPRVFLTGQKKVIYGDNVSNMRIVGLAINALDNRDKVMSVIEELCKLKIKIVLRPHPAQPKSDLEYYLPKISRVEGVEFSDPRTEDIEGFLSRITYLVSGNSSVLLEAAIAKVVPIYFFNEDASSYDYYGYVKNGIAVPLCDLGQLSFVINNTNQSFIRKSSVRYYSSTYGTEWEGKEGSLVASILHTLRVDGDVEQFKEFYHCDDFFSCQENA